MQQGWPIIVACTIIALTVPACRRASSLPSLTAAAAKPENLPDRLIGPGDRLVVQIPDLYAPGVDETFERAVDNRGNVTLPLYGTVRVAGMRLSELPERFRRHAGDIECGLPTVKLSNARP